MTVVLRIYESADRSLYNDRSFDTIEDCLSKLNAFGEEPEETRIYWGHGFTIFNEGGDILKDEIYPPVE